MLEGGAPEVRVGLFDVRVYRTQAHSRKRLAGPAARQRAQVVERDRNSGNVRSCIELNCSVIGRVLDHVEGDVAEVPLIRHAVAAAQGGLAVAEAIPGDTNPRSEIGWAGIPQFAVRAILGKHYLTVGNPLKDVRAATKVEVGIKVLVCVVLCAKILITHTQVQCEPRLYL